MSGIQQLLASVASPPLTLLYATQNASLGANTVVLPMGTVAGDICIITAQDNNQLPPISGTGGTGWTSATFNLLTGGTYRIVLTSTQISGTITLTFSSLICTILVLVIKGGSAINALSVGQGANGVGSDSQSWTGVTKTVGSKALIMVSADYDSAMSGTQMVLSSPTLAGIAYAPTGGDAAAVGNFRSRGVYDLSASQYANGTSLTISGLGTTWTQAAIHIFDIT